jgi:hopanoid biosynthesis associated RND transporter like protein HpnN
MQRIVGAQPMIGTLAADPSVRGVVDTVALMLDGAREGRAPADVLVAPLDAFAAAFESIVAGNAPAFSWQALFAGGAPEPRALRRFILVQPVLDYTALQPGERATSAIRNAARALRLDMDPSVRVRLTGPIPLADDEFSTLADGAALNATAMLAAVIALLWIAVRSWRITGAVLASIFVGLAVTAAAGLLMFGAFNLISVAFAILFVGLGVDFGIQFCVSYRGRRHRSDDLHAALRGAAADVGAPLALAALSIAAGFYAFLPTDYRGVSELGVIAGTGMIIAFIATVTLLPALLALLRPRGERQAVGYPALAGVDRLLLRHRRRVLIAAVVVAAVGGALLPRLRFDFNPLHLRSPDAESVATLLDLMKDPGTAPDTIDVLVPSVAAGTALARRLEQLPEVDHVLAITTFVPDDQDAKLATIDDAALLLGPTLEPAVTRPPPDDAELARAMTRTSQSLDDAGRAHAGGPFAISAARLGRALRALAEGTPQMRERAHQALIPGLVATLAALRQALQATPVTLASLPAEIVGDWVAPDGRARIEAYPKGDVGDNASLRRFVVAVQVLAPDATGAPVAIEASSRTIVGAFTQAGLLALVSVTLLLGFALRRAADVARALLPLLLALLGTLGTCAVIGLPLNFENIIALPLMIGIGVAFDIYFVMAWRAGRAQLLQSSLARAVVMSALTTGTAFGSLWLSHHPGTSSMGKLLALSLAWTLASVLLFLPALLGAAPRRADERALQRER